MDMVEKRILFSSFIEVIVKIRFSNLLMIVDLLTYLYEFEDFAAPFRSRFIDPEVLHELGNSWLVSCDEQVCYTTRTQSQIQYQQRVTCVPSVLLQQVLHWVSQDALNFTQA